jgi:hypothetical protein
LRILLDEMLPVGVADLLPEHDVMTAKAAGYAGLSNGELIRGAVADGFEVLLTADRNLPAQQNVAAAGIAVVLVPGNRVTEIARREASLRSAVVEARAGTVTRLAGIE